MSPAPISLASFPDAIMHVDCDAFFTSVEESLRPEFKGKPLITGAERNTVVCASYAAKARGVKRPMQLYEAKRICPELICLPSDYASYGLFSERMLAIMRRFTPDVEAFSIDEAYANLAGLRRTFRMSYSGIAREIKMTVQKELNLTVSAGLSASKTLAKIASERTKPDGFTVVRANELHHFLPQVKLEEVCGFGPNISAFLKKKGLRTAWDYVSQPPHTAKAWLGKIGLELWHELRGQSVYPVKEIHKQPLSIMKVKTFTPPSPDKKIVYAQLIRNLEIAFAKLRRLGLHTAFISICLRSQDFKITGTEIEMESAVSSAAEALGVIQPHFEKVFKNGTSYRMTGVTLGKLTPQKSARQYSFFDNIPREESFKRLSSALDDVNQTFGRRTLETGTNLHISPKKPERRMALPFLKINL